MMLRTEPSALISLQTKGHVLVGGTGVYNLPFAKRRLKMKEFL